MRLAIRIIVPLFIFAGCVFGDIKLAQLLFGHLPDVSWVFWLKFIISFVIFWFTVGIIFLATFVSGLIAFAVTEG